MRHRILRLGEIGWRSANGPQLAELGPGLLLCCVIAMAAAYIGIVQGGPQMLYALAFGAAFHFQSLQPRTEPGVSFCMRGVLRLGIGLLGARLTTGQIAALGWPTVAITIAAVGSTLLCGRLLALLLGLPARLGLLAGGACAICGAAAALAIAAALPPHPDKSRQTVAVVALATLCSTLAALLYPLLARGLGLTDLEAGLFIGGTLHDVAQVVVAGYTLGHQAGDSATVVKLLRVSLLTLVVLGISVGASRQAGPAEKPAAGGRLGKFAPPVPWFLWLFIAMVALHSCGLLGGAVQKGLVDASTACLMVGVTALGMNTSFTGLTRIGWKPVSLMVACSLWIAGFVLAAIAAGRHWL